MPLTPAPRRRAAILAALAALFALPAVSSGQIRLSGANGMTVPVAGVKQAEKSALLVQPKERAALQRVPWQLFDMGKLKVEHPGIHSAFLKAQAGGAVVLDLGSCEGSLPSRTFTFDPESGFEELTGVEWLDNRYMDGDSFHAMAGGERRIFRLYHVDCPETDMNFPDRIDDQKEYFGIGREALLKLAGAATAETIGLLKGGKLTVYTKWVDARGNSQIPRHYAYVVLADGTLLSEQLVAKGLARVYGMKEDAPDGTSKEEWISHLESLEEDAKTARRGGWAKPLPKAPATATSPAG